MLIGRFIPGRRNVLEDQLSRWHQVISKEWILHPRISQAVLERWGTPMVAFRHRPQSATPSVLFASTRPLGMEGRRLHGAMGSSRSLCLPVLRSLLLGHQPCVGDQQLRMILVAPARVVSGSAKPSSEEPLQLPPPFFGRTSCFSHTQTVHGALDHWRLHAWRLLSVRLRERFFLDRLRVR